MKHCQLKKSLDPNVYICVLVQYMYMYVNMYIYVCVRDTYEDMYKQMYEEHTNICMSTSTKLHGPPDRDAVTKD